MSFAADTLPTRPVTPPSRPARTRRTRSARLLLGAAALCAATVLSACSTPAPAPQSVAAAQPTPATTTTDAGVALGAVPGGKDDSTKSFRLTSSTYTVKGDKTDGPHKASCADGYYVRAAPGGSQYDPIVASVHLDVSNASGNVHVSSAAPADSYGAPNGAFKSFNLSVRSWTPYTHTYTFSWWCDKLPDWWKTNPAAASGKRPAASPSAGKVGDIKNMDLDALINNGSSQWTLNNSGNTFAENNPIIAWPFTAGAGNQKLWGVASSADYDGLAVYSYWAYQPVIAKWVITADPGGQHALHIHASGGGVPRGGFWAMIRAGVQAPPGAPGAWYESVLLFNTDYNQCLTGAVDQGVALQLADCDTNDPNQYWTLKPMKAIGG